MAAAVFFSAVSCVKEDVSSSLAGGEVEVTFTANLADLGTRAYGDGKAANKVVYLGIYSKEGELLEGLTNLEDGYGIAEQGNSVSIPVVLLKGKEYQLVFWAQYVGAECYDMNWTDRKLTVKYPEDLTPSQDEMRDAFFHVDNNFKAGETKNPEFTLKRPFAQLRAAISEADYGFIKQNEVSIVNSKAVVTNVANVLDLSTEEAKAVGTSTVTFDSAAIPTGDDATILVAGKKYYQLSMNYLLVDTKRLVDVTYEFEDATINENDATAATTYKREYYQVPVQRNYRTNIVGQLISSPYEFEVIIDSDFEKDELNNPLPDYTYVTTIEEMQAVLDAAAQKGEDLHVVLGADLVGDVTVLQAEGANITIDGLTKEDGIIHSFDGTITINGNARSTGKETLTITNIKFATESAKTFIDAPTKVNGKYNYSHNVTVDNCTFSAAEYNEEVVGIKLLTTYNAVVKNCTAENIHSLAQFQSTDNATVIENVKVLNCKNGISLGNMASATISGSVIYAKGYGVRLDGAKEREVAVTISGSRIEAYIPVNVRKMNNDACKASIKLVGENALVGKVYDIALCSNEYEEGVDPEAPKGTFSLEGHAGCDVYPVFDKESFAAAVANPLVPVVDVVDVVENVGLGFEVERDVVLNFNNNEFNAGSDANSLWYAIEAYGKNVEINDANFTRAGIFAGEGANVVFNSGVINHKPERTSRYIFCAKSGATITVKDGTFKNDRAKNSFFWADNATIVVEGGNFGGVASNNKVVLSNGGQVIIKGGTFNFDPTAWVAEGYAAVKKGNLYYVGTAAASVDTLKAAITNENADVVVLTQDVNVTETSTPWVNIARKVTITTNENTLMVGNAANYGLFCNAGADVTLENANVLAAGGGLVVRDGATLTVNSGTYQIESTATAHRHMIYAYGEGTTITINGGEFSFDAYRKRTYGYVADGAVLYIAGGVFGPAPNHPSDANAPFIAEGGQIIITGGTFGFNPSAWVADGYTATQNGSVWTVSKQ